MKHWALRGAASVVLALCAVAAAAGCGGAPQIVDYGPEKGATGVPTNAPIRVDFDRAVDRASVASRLVIQPAASGRMTWRSSRELLYVPTSPLRTDTTYRVLLRAGYRSQGGGAADLDHTWYFRTEGALQVTDTNPASAQRGVDPAAYLEITFNHRISSASLAGAFALDPSTPVQASLATSDPFRVVVAPAGLLSAGADYTLTVTPRLKDADGNALPKPTSIAFRTGPVRPLHGWITCLASKPGDDPNAADLWMVDQNRLPRELLSGPVGAYEWAPTADELALQVGERSWQDRRLDGTSAPIPIAADRVIPLGDQRGYVYLDHANLGLLSSSGLAAVLAAGVAEAELSPDGQQVAYSVPATAGTELWVVSVELRSRYQLGTEPGAVSDIAWSPDSSRLAYEVVTDAGASIRVRALASTSSTTVATGEVSAPAWDSDSAHLYLLAARGAPLAERLYRVPTGSGPQTLTPATALATPPGLSVSRPEPSPDGHQVAYVGSDSHGDEVWLMNSDGTGLVRLTGGPDYSYSCRAPKWTPPA